MGSKYYNAGREQAKAGGERACPIETTVSHGWRDFVQWYDGFDDATKNNENPKLTSKFSLRGAFL